MRNPILWAVAAALLILPVAANAQANGTVQATATVLQPLDVSPGDNLRFGNVFPGVSTTVVPSDVTNAGSFQITGVDNAQVSITFALPTALTLGSPVTDDFPITFDGNSAAWLTDNGGPFTFDPNTGTAQRLVNNNMTIFIGGTVSPAFGQAEGTYTGDVQMTVAYTGL